MIKNNESSGFHAANNFDFLLHKSANTYQILSELSVNFEVSSNKYLNPGGGHSIKFKIGMLIWTDF